MEDGVFVIKQGPGAAGQNPAASLQGHSTETSTQGGMRENLHSRTVCYCKMLEAAEIATKGKLHVKHGLLCNSKTTTTKHTQKNQ